MSANNRYAAAKFVKLSDFISAVHFRTITENLIHVPGGVSEIPVECEVSAAFASGISFDFSWDRKVFGMAHNNTAIDAVFAGKKAVPVKNRKIYLNDWDSKFLLLFEDSIAAKEYAFFVLPEEVRTLLMDCPYIGRPVEEK